MSDAGKHPLGILATGYGMVPVGQAFSMLCNRAQKGVPLFLFSDHKFNGRKRVKVRNVEADYPAALLRLNETARMACKAGASGQYFENGFALYCLEMALQREPCEGLLLLRRDADEVSAALDWLGAGPEKPFCALGQGPRSNMVLDARRPETTMLITRASGLFTSGAALALQDFSLETVLEVSWQSLADLTTRVAP